MRATLSRRGGFTLVELLVVVGIILVLAGLALLVANSGIIGNARTSSGSDRVSGWLMQARSKAQRDGAPRGIRFIADGNGLVREAQLIEVPEPYTMSASNWLMIEHVGPPTNTKRAFVIGPDAAQVANNVAIADTLSIPSAGTIHRITGFNAVPGGIALGAQPAQPAVEIVVANPALLPDLGSAALPVPPATPTPTYSTSTFGFLRQARPTFGEPPLLVPDSVAIMINVNSSTDPTNAASLSLIPLNPATGSYDIVFSPNGEVQNTAGLGRFVLWTVNPDALTSTPNANGPRAGGDVKATYEQSGEMRHIVVYTKSGAVAVQQVPTPIAVGANPGFDPYANTKDGVASGL